MAESLIRLVPDGSSLLVEVDAVLSGDRRLSLFRCFLEEIDMKYPRMMLAKRFTQSSTPYFRASAF